jgi:hypothetical protein
LDNNKNNEYDGLYGSDEDEEDEDDDEDGE